MSSSRSNNPESYYFELTEINPVFVHLADRLATVRRRLQMLEEVNRWSSGQSRAAIDAGIGDHWRARLLVSLDLVAKDIEDVFSDADGSLATGNEVSAARRTGQ